MAFVLGRCSSRVRQFSLGGPCGLLRMEKQTMITKDGRTGDWFSTFTGRQFYLTDPHPDDVDIKDIAHALSMVCRFGGHIREFYSVAQHSVHCAELVASWHPQEIALQLYTLLHDASEAYLGDVVRPLKYSMPNYLTLELTMQDMIYRGLGVSNPNVSEQQIIKSADDTLLMTERRDFLNHRNHNWNIPQEPIERRLEAWSPVAAEYQFRSLYDQLCAQLIKAAA